jgi:calcineurin-like phosphoesterase family protein
MFKDIIFIGDVHWKERPYSLGLDKLFEYWAKNYSNSIFIFTGDFFDTSRPHWVTYRKTVRLLKNLKSEIHILQGNHDTYANVGSALEPLEEHGFNIYNKKTEVEIQGIKFLFLPHTDVKSMSKYPEIEFEDGIIVTHFAPPKSNWGVGELDLPLVRNSTIIHGHIHNSELNRRTWEGNVEHIIGVPQTTRQGEEGVSKYMGILKENSKVTFEKLPTFFDIYTLKFGEKPSLPEEVTGLFKITDAPSEQAVYDLYPDIFIKDDEIGITTKEITLQTLDDIKKENGNLLEPLIAEWMETNKPDEKAMRRLLSKLTEVKQNQEQKVYEEIA